MMKREPLNGPEVMNEKGVVKWHDETIGQIIAGNIGKYKGDITHEEKPKL